MKSTQSTLRTIATLLAIALPLNQLAFAASPSHKLSAAQRASLKDVNEAQAAAQTAAQLAAPSPSQIVSAHTVFLLNAGNDSRFPVEAQQTYNQVYAALQQWGRYTLVGSPAEADLVFQVRGLAPVSYITGDQGAISTYTTPSYQLTIIDPKTSTPLWTIASPVTLTGKNATYARWQALSITNLVSRIKLVANEPLTPTETADLTAYPKTHNGRLIAIVGVSFVGLAAGGFFIAHHEFENSLADGKASQDAFCKANNIPLNECAGG